MIDEIKLSFSDLVGLGIRGFESCPFCGQRPEIYMLWADEENLVARCGTCRLSIPLHIWNKRDIGAYLERKVNDAINQKLSALKALRGNPILSSLHDLLGAIYGVDNSTQTPEPGQPKETP